MALAAFGQITLAYPGAAAGEPGAFVGLALTGFVVQVIVLTSGITTIQKLIGHTYTYRPANEWAVIASIAVFGFVFALAWLAGFAPQAVKSAALAVLSIPGIAIPVYWLLRFGARDWWWRNPKRGYGLTTFSFGISVPFIILLEVLIAAVILLMLAIGVSGNPRFLEWLSSIRNNPSWLQTDPTRLFGEVEAFISLPSILGWLLVVIAGIMPLVEELFKTLGVWVIQPRRPSPAESFTAGLISGGGFALIEGLLSVNSIQVGLIQFADWVGLIVGRFGGSLLHILTGGIIGLAIGKFWQTRKIGSLLFAYLASWILHAAWNTLAVFGGINPLIQSSDEQPIWPYIGMAILFIGMVYIYHRLIKKTHSSNVITTLTIGPKG